MSKSLNRRQFTSMALSACAVIAMPLPVIAAARRFATGTLYSFADGVMNLPVEMLFKDVPADQLAAGLGTTAPAGTMQRPVNVNLLDTGDRKILFDAGSGTNFLSTLGRLPAAFEAAGIDPAAITDVLLTHAHPDHLWGVLDDFDDLLMPDATYHMNRAEWAFWDSDAALAAMPAGRENFAAGAKSRFDKIRDQVALFDAGAAILPNIEAVDTAGHTPGHSSFLLHDHAGSVLIAGDALTHPVLSFRHPDWRNQSDMDGPRAAIARRRLLDRLAIDKIGLAATHLPAPGFGHVEKSGSVWRFSAD